MHIYRLLTVVLTATYVAAAPVHLDEKQDGHPANGQVANAHHHHPHKNHHVEVLSPGLASDDTEVKSPTLAGMKSIKGSYPVKRRHGPKVNKALERRFVANSRLLELVREATKNRRARPGVKTPHFPGGRRIPGAILHKRPGGLLSGHLGNPNIANKLKEIFQKMKLRKGIRRPA